jgi:hypothetical protein
MPTSIPRCHVLLVGIDDYIAVNPLFGCVNDIDAIEALLLDRLHVPADAITKLAAPHAGSERRPRLPERAPTYDNLRASLEALAGDGVEPGDRVLIYYAGHGTQVLPWESRIAREALVPSDTHEGAPLLYDYELNDHLLRIARRTGDLTVVLDCCCSAGATRRALSPRDAIVRFCPMDAPPRPRRRSTGDMAEAPGGFLSSLDPGDPGYLVAAACQSHEAAHEGRNDLDQQHGAFTATLLALVSAQSDDRLESLRWVDVWHALRERLSTRYPGQHPWLVGRAERRLFGGPFRLHDPGYAMAQEGTTVRIAAGTMVGLTPGARVAVYGPTPDFFPLIGSAEDRAARIGVLEVEAASPSSCTAAPIGSPFTLIEGARGRLVAPGKGDELVVQLEPHDAELARWLEREARLRIVLAARPPGEVDLVEAYVGQDADGRRWLGDEIHGQGTARGDGEPPLAWVPSGDNDALLRALLHYAKYNLTLRLPRRCRDLPGALRVRVLDCRNLSALAAMDLQDPRLPEVTPDPEGRHRYLLEHGQPVCVVVENRSSERLFANLLNCATSGRVEMLGTTQLELPPGRKQTFWRRGHLGDAFRCGLPSDRASGIDRLVAVASTAPDVDLSFLKEARSFDEAIRSSTRDMLPEEQQPRELWTAAFVTMKIVRR